MALNNVQVGKRITYANATGADIASGDVVVVGSLVAIASVDIPDGGVGELEIGSVFEVPKAAADDIKQGDALDFDISEGVFTNDLTEAAGDLIGAAVAWADAAATTATVCAYLAPVPSTIAEASGG